MSSCYKPVQSEITVSLLQHVRFRWLCLQFTLPTAKQHK